jgi:hypothetical protein
VRKRNIRKPGKLRGFAEISKTLDGEPFIFVEGNALETKEALRLSAWLKKAAEWIEGRTK